MYPESLKNLIESFKMLPGIGEKTAERMAFFILDTDVENICYRIEDETSWIREEGKPMVQHMDLSIFDIMSDCYEAKRIGSYKTEVYYSNYDNKVYEITYDCTDFRIVEINSREAEPGEADKKQFLDDIKDYLIIEEEWDE